MEINETAILDDKGFVQINGADAKDFLQNIVTNNIEKITTNFTLFASILTPQGKYLHEFFLIKLGDGYLLECEKIAVTEIIKNFNFYKLRSKVNLVDVSENYTITAISLEKFKEISKVQASEGCTIPYNKNLIYVDPRNQDLGAKILSKKENVQNLFKDLKLKIINKDKYYAESFNIGIPQINLDKLKNKIFGIESNLDELGGIDFKKGCYVGQENTSRIKLRNKLRRRILPVKKISGELIENDIIKYNNKEIGKIIIDKPYSFALIKVVDPDLKEFVDQELDCAKSKVKIFKPDWI